jgi:phage tail sheath protein FI/ribosome-associated protein YbcJ (S4-like RNA binding protein)
MAEYLSPGVYVEEIDAGPKPIEGVSTSTAGAAGITLFGPTTGKPELVTSFAEFIRKFGGFMPDPSDQLYNQWANNPVDGGRWWQFPLAVKGFFDNGGQRLYVKRVLSGAAVAANVKLGKGVVSEIVADTAADSAILKLRHLIGLYKGKKIAIKTVADPPVTLGTFTVINYDSSALSITLEKALGTAIKARQAYVQVTTNIVDPVAEPTKLTLSIEAKDRGACGNDIYFRVRPMLGSILTILPDPITGGPQIKTAVNKTTVTWVIEVDDAASAGIASGTKVKIKGHEYDVKNLDGNIFEVNGRPPDDVVNAAESTGGKETVKGPGAKVAKATASATDTLTLDDVTKLFKGDSIDVDGSEYTILSVTKDTAPAGKIKVSPVPTVTIANKDVKRLTAKIQRAGTRRTVTVADASGLKDKSEITFGGRKYTLKADPDNNSFPISPAIPFGKDWESKGIVKTDTAGEIKTTLTAAGDTVEVKDTTNLKVNDEVIFKEKKFKIVAVIAPVAPAVPPEGSIKVSPAFAAPDLPQANDKITKETVVPVVATAATWVAEVANPNGLSDGDPIVLNGGQFTIDSVNGSSLTILSHKDGGDPWPAGTTLRKLRKAATATAKQVRASNTGLLYKNAIVELDNGENKETNVVESVTGDTVTLVNPLANDYLESHKLRIVEAQVNARQIVNGQILKDENFVNLQLHDNKDLNFLGATIKTLSSLLAPPVLGPGFPDPNQPGDLADLANFPIASNGDWAKLENGADNIEQLSVDDFVGEDKGKGNRTGVQAFEDIDEISICLVPCMWSPVIHAGLIGHCEALKDRFAILDPKDDLSIEQIREFREPYDTKYAALYYPWIEVRDTLAKRNVELAPSGHLAGIYARVDVERGVHKAPANEVVRGITKIAQEITKREQDLLNPRNINVLRFFPGRGNRVWGARVVTSDSAWKYINVRRLFIYVEESIDEGTQWVVFEPNDEPLWARVRATITNFLISTWRSGALQGAKPDEAFFVKCDRTTMTQDDIDNGRLICVIGIAPVKPAEFVIFRIQQKTLETKVG